MNWNPVVDALVEEYLGACEWRHSDRSLYRCRGRGRQEAVLSVAAKLGLQEQLSKRLDYLLDEGHRREG